MAEDIFSLNKDTLIIKPLKKSQVLLRTIVLIFSVAFGVHICSICVKQSNTLTDGEPLSIKVIDRPCCDDGCDKTQIPYLHYPKPETFSRAECACHPVRLFVIISMQRSGSGWFESLLNSHLNVSSNGEIFLVHQRRDNMSSITRTLNRVYNLDWLSSASKNHCSAAVGFKWMLNQGLLEHHDEIEEYFNRRGVSVIFLFRRNLLRRMVSLLANSYDRYAKLFNGTHKSHVHSLAEAEALLKFKPFIDSSSLMNDLKEMELTAAKALEYFRSTRHIFLYYEDLIRDPTKLVDVQEFLKVPLMKLTSRQVKIHQGSLTELIWNWDEVNKTLQGTTYESFLGADY